MKYSQHDFSSELSILISSTEQTFIEHCELLLERYKHLFAQRKKRIHLEVIRIGSDPFMKGYFSFVLAEIAFELTTIRIHVPIWECKRFLLGIPFSIKIPGSKLIGELITLEDAKHVFEQFFEDNLK